MPRFARSQYHHNIIFFVTNLSATLWPLQQLRVVSIEISNSKQRKLRNISSATEKSLRLWDTALQGTLLSELINMA
ncbi:hypothetical protein E4U13_006855 [Claviceps humidiphila]|uniref:Uncharacterized protein n=1 Tax=Claviceps humidiphila TaxID=1294629 RepID=A0A9P7TUB9_9HYPO|nr:hypothetical protein E4U13_006855 [Claviceps humidiphila]